MLTINAPNLPSDPTFNLTENGFHFAAKAGNKAKGVEEKDYDFKLDFFDKIDVEVSAGLSAFEVESRKKFRMERKRRLGQLWMILR